MRHTGFADRSVTKRPPRAALITTVLAGGLSMALAWLLYDSSPGTLLEGPGWEDSEPGGPIARREPSLLHFENSPGGTAPAVRSPVASIPPTVTRPMVIGRAFIDHTTTPLSSGELRMKSRQGDRTIRRQLTTGDQGDFWLDGLEPGSHILTFWHPDALPVSLPVSLVPGDVPVHVEIVFERGIEVWGRVVDSFDQPAPDVTLQWARSEAATEKVEIHTDRDGVYRVASLEPGTHLVKIFPRSPAVVFHDPRTTRVMVQKGRSNRFDFTVDLGASLSVHVLRKDGSRVPSAEVRYFVRSKGRGWTGFLPLADTNGKTVLHGLPNVGSLTLETGDAWPDQAHVQLDLAELPETVNLTLATPRL